MRILREAIKKVFGNAGEPPEGFLELAVLLPRLFVLRPTSGSGLAFLQSLDKLGERAKTQNDAVGPKLREDLLEESYRFSKSQKLEFEELVADMSSSAEEFLSKLSFFVEVQSARLSEIETVRKNLEGAQNAKTLEETRQQLSKGMSSLQKMVENELQRKSDICMDRDAYASRLEDKLVAVEKESRTDILTGVANRAGCIKRIEGVIDFVRTNGSEFSLALIDLNRFKSINDTLGHAAGDAALVAFAQRLEATMGKSNFVGRLSGDEFIVVTSLPIGSLSSLLNRLDEQFKSMPASHKGLSLNISFCYGICRIVKGASPTGILEEADRMLYRSKNVYYETQAA